MNEASGLSLSLQEKQRRGWLGAQKTLNWIEDLAGSGLITERDHPKSIEKLTALVEFIMPMYNNTKLDCMYENQ